MTGGSLPVATWRARIARAPTATSDTASPTLNAAIRTSPRAVRPIDTEPRRTTSALGDGRIPPANASATSLRRERGRCRVRMVVPVSPPLRERVDPRDEQGGAETEGDQAGGEPEPWVDAFGREDPLRGQDQEAEAEHRGGVHHRDRGADGGGLTERAAGADQVRADQGLAVAGAERMDRADADRHRDHQGDQARPRDRSERRSRRGALRSPAPPLRIRAAPAELHRPDGTSSGCRADVRGSRRRSGTSGVDRSRSRWGRRIERSWRRLRRP